MRSSATCWRLSRRRCKKRVKGETAVLELFAMFFNEIFGDVLLLIWIAPPLVLFAAYIIYIVIKTIREFRK